MSYATEQDFVERYSSDMLLRLTDRDGDDQPDIEVLNQAFFDASAEIDSYVGVKYSTPITPTPSVLVRLCVDIAVYRLASSDDAATEEQRKRYEDAIGLLRRISKGEVKLGAPETTKKTAGSAHLISKPKRFGRGQIL